MLAELERYESLGTPSYFWELLKRLDDDGVRWTVENIREHFFNRIVDGRSVFDGCISFAQAAGILNVDHQSVVQINGDFANFLMSERHMRGKMLEWTFSALEDDEVFQTIFSPRYMSYDVIYNLIQIDNSAFGFRFANFRQLLVDFDFLSRHPDRLIRKLIVNQRYRTLFDRIILPEVKRRKIGIENLEEMLAQRQIRGAEAEEFVLIFEKTRLSSHTKPQGIQKISDYDVGAGYDIVSYENVDSSELDRFIEVKSCSVDRRFHWSKNEVSQARIMRDQYFLYLVDPRKIPQVGYEPLIIRNPYENIFMNDGEWKREEQSWLFQPGTNGAGAV
jgi:hypothetical protein